MYGGGANKTCGTKKNTPYIVGGNKNIYMLYCVADKIKESIDVFYVYKLFTTIVVNIS